MSKMEAELKKVRPLRCAMSDMLIMVIGYYPKYETEMCILVSK